VNAELDQAQVFVEQQGHRIAARLGEGLDADGLVVDLA